MGEGQQQQQQRHRLQLSKFQSDPSPVSPRLASSAPAAAAAAAEQMVGVSRHLLQPMLQFVAFGFMRSIRGPRQLMTAAKGSCGVGGNSGQATDATARRRRLTRCLIDFWESDTHLGAHSATLGAGGRGQEAGSG